MEYLKLFENFYFGEMMSLFEKLEEFFGDIKVMDHHVHGTHYGTSTNKFISLRNKDEYSIISLYYIKKKSNPSPISFKTNPTLCDKYYPFLLEYILYEIPLDVIKMFGGFYYLNVNNINNVINDIKFNVKDYKIFKDSERFGL